MQEWFDTHPCPVGADLTPETASTYLQHVSQASTAVGLGGIKGWFSVTWRDEALVANIYSVKRVCIGSLRLASNLNKKHH